MVSSFISFVIHCWFIGRFVDNCIHLFSMSELLVEQFSSHHLKSYQSLVGNQYLLYQYLVLPTLMYAYANVLQLVYAVDLQLVLNNPGKKSEIT